MIIFNIFLKTVQRILYLVKITFPLPGQPKMKGKQCSPSSKKQSTNYTQQALELDRVCLLSLPRERGNSEAFNAPLSITSCWGELLVAYSLPAKLVIFKMKRDLMLVYSVFNLNVIEGKKEKKEKGKESKVCTANPEHIQYNTGALNAP